MATKTRRFETRLDPETDRLIEEAAAELRVSKAQFVSDAARSAAQKVVARADVTLMDAPLFDAMVASLDEPDDAPGLAALAAQPRLIRGV